MKNKRWLLVLLTTLFLCLMTSSSVFAKDDEDDDTTGDISELFDTDDPVAKFAIKLFGQIYDLEYNPDEYMEGPDEEKYGGVQLEIKKYPVEHYMVNNEDTSGIFGFNLYAINNLFMGIIQRIVEVTDSALELFTSDNLDDFADDIESISGDVYKILKKHFAETLFVFLCGYLLFIFFTKGNARESFRKFMLFVIVLIVAGYWVSNASYLLKSMNALSGEIQSSLVSAGSGILDIMDDKRGGFYAGVEDIDEDEKIEGTIAVLRNIYFDLALKRPYLLMNYGKTNENDIDKADKIKDIGFGFEKYPRSERMLAFELNSQGTAYRIGYAHIEAFKNNNTNVGSGSVFKQSGMVFLTFFIVIGLSIPFLLLGLINFALQLLAVFLALCLPFAFVLSFIPHFAMTGFKALGNIVTIFLTKGLLGILLFAVYLLTYAMYVFVKPNSTGMYLLHVVLLIVLFFLIIAKRNKIISFITAGHVQTVSGAMPNMNQYYGQQFSNSKKRLEERRTNKRVSPMSYGNEEGESKQRAKTNRTSMNEERKGTEKGAGMQVNRTPQRKKKNDEEKTVAVPLKTNAPSKERTKQGEKSDGKPVEAVKKENQPHTEDSESNKGDVERTKQLDSVKKGTHSDVEGYDEKDGVERTKQLERSNEKEFEGVKKENRPHTDSHSDKKDDIDRNNQSERTNERQVESVKKENHAQREVHYDTALKNERNRKVGSVEESKKERDEM